MNFNSLLNISAEIIEKLSSPEQLQTKTINQEIKLKNFLGSKDRKIVSNLIFLFYKYYLTIKFVTKSDYIFQYKANKINIYSVFIIFSYKISTNQFNELELLIQDFCKIENIQNAIDNWLSKELNISNEEVAKIKDEIRSAFDEISNYNSDLSLSYLYSFNLDFISNISGSLDSDSESQLSTLNDEASTDIRINSKLIDIELLKYNLTKECIFFEEGQYSPICLKLSKRINLDTFSMYQKRQIEIQDEGSQLICYALNPIKNTNILDVCAGAGGKSLLLAYLTNNQSRITASDVNLNRMKELVIRKRQAGFDLINLKIIDRNNVVKFKEHFDFILIDAPCTGSGTVRRNPFLKYKITNQDIIDKAKLQYELLELYSQTVKIGGILVYATCSIFNLENEDIVNNFLLKYPNFEGSSLKEVFKSNDIDLNIKNENFMTYLTPNKNRTDGFFISRLKRIS